MQVKTARSEICTNCTEKYCCRGLCKEMNEYLLAEKRKLNKTKTEGRVENVSVR